MILTINGIIASIKPNSSIDYTSSNPLFTESEDWTFTIELPINAGNNRRIFGNICRKDIDINTDDIYFDAVLSVDGIFSKRGAVVVVNVTDTDVKVQFLAGRSYQNFFPDFDKSYIDELAIGNLDVIDPALFPPETAWNPVGRDIIALPWCNNTSGNIQNLADYHEAENQGDEGYWTWHTQESSLSDTEVVDKLSCQIRLYALTRQICDLKLYIMDADIWRNSDKYYLFVFNCLPAAWGTQELKRILPHWTINEYFDKLSELLGFSITIDHLNRVVHFAEAPSLASRPIVAIDKVIDEYQSTVTKEDESKYLPNKNVGYGNLDHNMGNFYSCPWIFRKLPNLKLFSYDTFAEVCTAAKAAIQRGTTHLHNQEDVDSLFYAKDVDTYFCLIYNQHYTQIKWSWKYVIPIPIVISLNLYRLQPVNVVGDRIVDEENWEEVERIDFSPVWCDETISSFGHGYKGVIAFFEAGSTDNVSSDGKTSEAGVADDEDTSLAGIIKAGYEEQSTKYSSIQVGYWFGNWQDFGQLLPHPFIDSFDTSFDIIKSGNDYYQEFKKIESGESATLRLATTSAIAAANVIEPKIKYEFSFLYKGIPDVGSIFQINGKKYLCAEIKASMSPELGLSEKLQGTFYRLLE